jgi:hypothetical protein
MLYPNWGYPHKKWRNSWDLYPQFFRKHGSFTPIEDFWICEKVWFGLRGRGEKIRQIPPNILPRVLPVLS